MASGPPSTIDIRQIEASQYVSAVGLVMLLWDHILTFPDEVRFIWKAKRSIPKVLFLFNRYIVPFGMIVQTHEFSGITPEHLSVTICKIWYATAVAVGMLSIATSNFLVLLRLWVLWDRNPRLVLGTLTFYIATQLTSLSLAGYVIYEMLPTLLFDPVLRICMPVSKPKLVLLWAPGIVFEVMVFLTSMWNALDQPRQRNTWMARIMYRDGSIYFVALFVLRLLNLLLSIFAPIELMFLGVFFIWSVANITLARLILNLRRESNRICGGGRSDDEYEYDCGYTYDCCHDGVERTELPVLVKRRVSDSDLPPPPMAKAVL